MFIVLLIVVSTFLVFSFIHFAAKKKKPYRRALLSMALGVLTLCAVDICSGFTGVYVPLTRLTLLTSLVGGVPGTALLVLLTAF